MSIKAIVAVALLVMPLAAQEQGRSSTCTVHDKKGQPELSNFSGN
jgi:hypothetical protein